MPQDLASCVIPPVRANQWAWVPTILSVESAEQNDIDFHRRALMFDPLRGFTREMILSSLSVLKHMHRHYADVLVLS